jgi:hypothetical protein
MDVTINADIASAEARFKDTTIGPVGGTIKLLRSNGGAYETTTWHSYAGDFILTLDAIPSFTVPSGSVIYLLDWAIVDPYRDGYIYWGEIWNWSSSSDIFDPAEIVSGLIFDTRTAYDDLGTNFGWYFGSATEADFNAGQPTGFEYPYFRISTYDPLVGGTGTNYSVVVATEDSATDWWMPAETPANDSFDNAEVITGSSGFLFATVAGATSQGFEPDGPGPHTIWYSWTAPSSGNFTFSTYGSEPWASGPVDSRIYIYTGSDIGSLVEVASNDDNTTYSDPPNAYMSEVTFSASSGTTYYINLSDYWVGSVSNFKLNWDIGVSHVSISSDTALATAEFLSPTLNNNTVEATVMTATASMPGGDFARIIDAPIMTAFNGVLNYGDVTVDSNFPKMLAYAGLKTPTVSGIVSSPYSIPEYVDSGAEITTFSGSYASATIPNYQKDDLILLFVETAGFSGFNDNFIANFNSSSMTRIEQLLDTSNYDLEGALFWKIATSSGTNGTLNWKTATNSFARDTQAVWVLIRGGQIGPHASSRGPGTDYQDNATKSTSFTAPGLTTEVDNNLIFNFIAAHNANNMSHVNPIDFLTFSSTLDDFVDPLEEIGDTGTGYSRFSVALTKGTKTSAGSTGDITGTTDNLAHFMYMSVAIEPYRPTTGFYLRGTMSEVAGIGTEVLFVQNDNIISHFEIGASSTEEFIIPIDIDTEFDQSTFGVGYSHDTQIAGQNSNYTLDLDNPGASGLSFSADGTKFYVTSTEPPDNMYQYDMITAGEISTATYTTSFSPSVANPHGVYFKPDGTKFWIVSPTTGNVHSYSCSTAWDISTASSDGITFSVDTQDDFSLSIYFKSDGTKFFTCGNENNSVYEYAMGTAWDISTATYTTSTSVGTQEASPGGIAFNSDGNILYLVGLNNKLYSYSLSTAWDISSMTYDSELLTVDFPSTSADDVFIIGDAIYILHQDGYINQYKTAIPYEVHVEEIHVWKADTDEYFSLEAPACKKWDLSPAPPNDYIVMDNYSLLRGYYWNGEAEQYMSFVPIEGEGSSISPGDYLIDFAESTELAEGNFTVPVSSLAEEGDLVLVWVYSQVGPDTITPPDSSWTELFNHTWQATGQSTYRQAWVYSHIYESGDTNYVFNLDSTGFGDEYNWITLTYRGIEVTPSVSYTLVVTDEPGSNDSIVFPNTSPEESSLNVFFVGAANSLFRPLEYGSSNMITDTWGNSSSLITLPYAGAWHTGSAAEENNSFKVGNLNLGGPSDQGGSIGVHLVFGTPKDYQAKLWFNYPCVIYKDWNIGALNIGGGNPS